ncbi:MAG: efflux RND transporter periplasmic adaptor subunit [Pseudohongiella sp.]|nr:efflux RND transporter periplasmic adaptor subunit [Pseudohongiella sp.]MDP2128669.1 efflux RND transporter periplasmic adaptor subunit [Pseudohongiella sp.]
MRKWIVGALALLVVIIYFFSTSSSAVRVETATVGQRDLMITVQEQGRTRARLPYTVTAPVNAYMQRTALIEGHRVEQGQALVELSLLAEDNRAEASYRANLQAAEARRRVAEASLTEAESTLARSRNEADRRERLYLDRLIGSEELELYRQAVQAAESRQQSARSSLAAAQAEIESARARLMGRGDNNESEGNLTLTAPVSGTVLRVHERGDRAVSAGTALFEISDGDALELVVDLLTQDAVRVSAGDEILISGWGSSEVLRGVVDYVEPQAFTKFSALGVEEQRVNVVGSLIQNHPSLGAGYRIEAAIVVARHEQTLAVPASALFRRNEQWHVFTVADGRASLREVRIGDRNREYAQVLDGLQPGTEVIIFPSDLVIDGAEVSAANI